MKKMLNVLFFFIYYLVAFSQLLFAEGGGMISDTIYREIISTARQENWKQSFLDADEDGYNVIKFRAFKGEETKKIYKFSVDDLADFRPSISNHGDKIGFWLKDNSMKNSLYIVKTDGSNLEKIASIPNGHWILWHPDDEKIIFSGSLDNEDSVYIVDIRSKKVETLNIGQLADGFTEQSLSPDGKKMLYSYRGGIYCYNFSTKKSSKIANGDWFAWSPAGDWIAYLEKGGISIFNPLTLEQRVLIKGKDIVAPIYWLPNGKYIIYGMIGSRGEIGSPYVVRISDRETEAIPENAWLLATWS